MNLSRMMRASAAALAMTMVAVGSASAQVIAGAPVNGTIGGNNAYSAGATIVAMDFSLAATYDVTSISHFGWHDVNFPQPSSISWWLYANNAGDPGGTLFSGTSGFTSTFLFNSFGYQITQYTVGLTGVTLGPGNYWLGFHNNGVSGDPHWDFATPGGNGRRTDDGVSWGGAGYEGSFEVTGVETHVTPEPASLVLLATGLGVIGVVARRKRSA